jgi:hypothetical protein
MLAASSFIETEPAMPSNIKTRSIYSPHPGIAMVSDWIANLPVKTGRSLDEWMELVRTAGPPTEKERREWLKSEYGLGTNSAWWIAGRAEGKMMEDDDVDSYLEAAERYVDEMFSGVRAGLRPIYNELLRVCLATGEEAKASPGKTIVSLYRNHVFAQIKPTNRTRIDLGFALRQYDGPLSERLIDTGGLRKGDRITHRIPITSVSDIDADVKHWLGVAYALDA